MYDSTSCRVAILEMKYAYVVRLFSSPPPSLSSLPTTASEFITTASAFALSRTDPSETRPHVASWQVHDLQRLPLSLVIYGFPLLHLWQAGER